MSEGSAEKRATHYQTPILRGGAALATTATYPASEVADIALAIDALEGEELTFMIAFLDRGANAGQTFTPGQRDVMRAVELLACAIRRTHEAEDRARERAMARMPSAAIHEAFGT